MEWEDAISEIRHLREKVAERHVDYRDRFDKLDMALDKMDKRQDIIDGKTREARGAVRLLVLLVTLTAGGAAAFGPWLVRAAVRDAIEQTQAKGRVP